MRRFLSARFFGYLYDFRANTRSFFQQDDDKNMKVAEEKRRSCRLEVGD
jgi:hypothetical protein